VPSVIPAVATGQTREGQDSCLYSPNCRVEAFSETACYLQHARVSPQETVHNVHRALEDAGRDPATLTLTSGIFVVFEGAKADAPERAIRGTPDQVADALAGYAELGIEHLITHVFPRNIDSVRRLAEAAALARERLGAPAAV
jgi:hypothetical protein